MNNYETVFILNPVLSEDQAKDTVEKFVKVLKKAKAEILNNEQWGLKKMAYPINKKSTGFYNLIEFSADLRRYQHTRNRVQTRRISNAFFNYRA